MAYFAKVGSFNIDPSVTAGNTQAVTGVGFTPKIVLFWWGGSTGTGDSVAGGDIRYGFGAATSTSSRFAVTCISLDALATSDASRYSVSDACIFAASTTSGIDG